MINRVALTANVAIGVDALRIHPLRTALSVAGIIIGSASLVATMAMSDGMMGFARGQIMRQTSVQVVTISSRTIEYRRGRWSPIADYPVFTLADADAARRGIPRADAITMTVSGRAPARFRGVEQDAAVTLGTADLPDFVTLEITPGWASAWNSWPTSSRGSCWSSCSSGRWWGSPCWWAASAS